MTDFLHNTKLIFINVSNNCNTETQKYSTTEKFDHLQFKYAFLYLYILFLDHLQKYDKTASLLKGK